MTRCGPSPHIRGVSISPNADQALQSIYSGESIAQAIQLDPAQLEGLRRQAEALMTGGKWAPCLQALDLLDRLGAAGPFDALMRARCHRQLGQDDEAQRWQEVAQSILHELDSTLAGAGGAS